jgi:hypothetical protein
MRVQHRIFESATKSWEDLCDEAAEFATEVGRERLINLSVAASGGTEGFGFAGRGVIVVWYWE